MLSLLRLEIRRMLTDVRFLVLMLVLPVAMYLLFTNTFGNTAPIDGLSAYVRAMISMAAFGAIGAALMASGPRIAQERTSGWLRQLKIMPIPAGAVILAKTLTAMVWGLPAILLVFATAVLNHGVSLPAWQWFAIGGLLWVGAAPFAALGAFIGYVTDDNSAFAVMYGILLFLSALGGLWMPVNTLPSALQHISAALPSNRYAELGWRLASGQALSAPGAAILAGWLVLFAALAALGYRRANAVR